MEIKYVNMCFILVCTLILAGCETTSKNAPTVSAHPDQPALSAPIAKQEKLPPKNNVLGNPANMYSSVKDNGFHIPAVNIDKMSPAHVRQIVTYKTTERPGTVVVNQNSRYLYFVLENDQAIRYAVGVGPASRNFQGTARIAYKQAWPRWTPTQSMLKRNPKHYGQYKNGVNGGPNNPMGARALYIYKDGKDTYYRVHGTNAPDSIGKAVSAGCIRLLPQDIIDLHKRVQPGAKIIIQ